MILRHVTSATMALILITLIIHLWSIFAPVVVFMKAGKWQAEGQSVSASITGYKLKSCNVVKGSSVGWAKFNGEWSEVPFAFIADDTPDSTRPAEFSRQSFGRWSWTLPVTTDQVRLTMQHECDGEVRTTVIGPFVYNG